MKWIKRYFKRKAIKKQIRKWEHTQDEMAYYAYRGHKVTLDTM